MKSCVKCNVQLHDHIEVCPYCGAKQPIKKKIPLVRNCKKCGFELTRDMDFCPHCGTVPEDAENNTLNVTNKAPAPVKCAKCNSDRVQVLSEYVELNQKEPYALFGFLNFFGFVLAGIGLICILIAYNSCSNGQISFFALPSGIIGLVLFGLAIFDWILVSLAQLFQPYKHETRIRAVCLDCGKTWIIERVSNAPVEEQNSSSEQ